MLDEAIKHAKQQVKMDKKGFIGFRDKNIQVFGRNKIFNEIPGEFIVKNLDAGMYQWEVMKKYKGYTFFYLTNERPKEGSENE